MRASRMLVAIVAFAVVAWAVVVAVVVVSYDPGLIDLRVYRAGGDAWLHDLSLYDPRFPWSDTHPGLPFTYPPISAVLFAGLTLLPWWVAVGVVVAAGIAGLAWTCRVTAARLPSSSAASVGAMSVAVLAAAGMAVAPLLEPVRETLSFGQVNLILATVVALDCLLRRTPWPRGALIGVAAAIKLTPAAFLLFFVARREWRPVVAAIASFLAVSLGGWLLAPADSRAYWLTVLPDSGRIGGPEFASNQSLRGLVSRFGLADGAADIGWLVASIAVVAAAFVAVAALRRRGDDVGALVVTAAAALLVSPVSWSHHWVWVVPGVLWLGERAWRLRTRASVAALVGVVAVFASSPHWWFPYRDARELDWNPLQHALGNAYVWAGIAVVAVAFVSAVRGRAPRSRPRATAPLQEPAS